MNEIAWMAIGAVPGLAAAVVTHLTLRPRTRSAPTLEGARWERRASMPITPAIRSVKRYNPTCDVLPGHPFLDLVTVRGTSGGTARRRCGEWTVGAVLVEKRTGAIARVVLWSDDPDLEEKIWILRRTGYRVVSVNPAAHGEDEAAAA